MASNLFENPEGIHDVLVNAEGQHSLWPAPTDVAEGWQAALEKVSR
ncbi:MbtH family NRPS accessory protein [Streptomyces platensis]